MAMGELWDILLRGGGRKSIIMVGGSQALSTCPSDRENVEVKTLGWLEAVAWDRGRGILVFWNNVELCSLEKNILVALTETGLCLKAEETQETLCRVGRSQDLPDAHWHLASSSANKRIRDVSWLLFVGMNRHLTK
jgi:hypothetical protein